MTRNAATPLGITCALVLATAFLGVPHDLERASANGATRQVVKSALAGPYELQVGLLPGSPKVGNLHLSIQVKDAGTGATITDAAVRLTASGPEGAVNVGPTQAVNTPQSPQYYDADIPLDTEGQWVLTLEVDGALGQASLDLTLDVQRGGGFNLIFLFAGALAVLTLAFWTWRRTRPRQRRRGQPP